MRWNRSLRGCLQVVMRAICCSAVWCCALPSAWMAMSWWMWQEYRLLQCSSIHTWLSSNSTTLSAAMYSGAPLVQGDMCRLLLEHMTCTRLW